MLRDNTYWVESYNKKALGSDPSMNFLLEKKPAHWVCGHMHYKFKATVRHKEQNTEFLALSKPVRGKDDFIEFLDLPQRSLDRTLSHDLEWLSILNVTHRPPAFTAAQKNTFRVDRGMFSAAKSDIEARLGERTLEIDPNSFVRTKGPGYKPMIDFSYNPQTFALQELVGIKPFFLSGKH